MLSEPHGIIAGARGYLAGSKQWFTSKQSRRTVQEIFRTLAADLGMGDSEVLLNAIKDGLNEDGLSDTELSTVIKFFDLVRERLDVRPQAGTLAGVLTPSIINALKLRRDFDGDLHSSIAEDRQLVAALLDDARVRGLLNQDGYRTERELIGRYIAYADGFSGDDLEVLLDFYETAIDPKAADRKAKQAKLDELRRQASALELELALL